MDWWVLLKSVLYYWNNLKENSTFLVIWGQIYNTLDGKKVEEMPYIIGAT